jgi:hypothetical protein
LKKTWRNCLFARLSRSRKALAVPMTFLILFVSTLGLISVTYYFAVEKVNTRSQTLKISTAKQDLLSLDQNLVSVVSQPGSARTFEVADSDGKLNVQPFNNSLTITVNDGREINEVVFNETIGQIYYELPFSESPETGLFLKGDSRTVVNQSGSVITQLCIVNGAAHPEIMLHYRPAASCAAAGVEDNRTINNLRLYVVNLNASEPIAQYGRVPLKISCESTQMITRTYELSYSPETLLLTSVLDGASGQVSIPISSTDSGAIINLEIVQCNIKVERSVM